MGWEGRIFFPLVGNTANATGIKGKHSMANGIKSNGSVASSSSSSLSSASSSPSPPPSLLQTFSLFESSSTYSLIFPNSVLPPSSSLPSIEYRVDEYLLLNPPPLLPSSSLSLASWEGAVGIKLRGSSDSTPWMMLALWDENNHQFMNSSSSTPSSLSSLSSVLSFQLELKIRKSPSTSIYSQSSIYNYNFSSSLSSSASTSPVGDDHSNDMNSNNVTNTSFTWTTNKSFPPSSTSSAPSSSISSSSSSSSPLHSIGEKWKKEHSSHYKLMFSPQQSLPLFLSSVLMKCCSSLSSSSSPSSFSFLSGKSKVSSSSSPTELNLDLLKRKFSEYLSDVKKESELSEKLSNFTMRKRRESKDKIHPMNITNSDLSHSNNSSSSSSPSSPSVSVSYPLLPFFPVSLHKSRRKIGDFEETDIVVKINKNALRGWRKEWRKSKQNNSKNINTLTPPTSSATSSSSSSSSVSSSSFDSTVDLEFHYRSIALEPCQDSKANHQMIFLMDKIKERQKQMKQRNQQVYDKETEAVEQKEKENEKDQSDHFVSSPPAVSADDEVEILVQGYPEFIETILDKAALQMGF